MLYFYLLFGGGIAALTHFYLVWIHRGKGKYSISEHAVADSRSHVIYFAAHVLCEILILKFSYEFYVVRHQLLLPYYFNVSFAIFDFVQATAASKGKTEKLHYVTAYISWVSYILSGIIAFFLLDITIILRLLSLLFLVPALALFIYIHFRRSKLYPYQLAIVPLYVLFLLCVVIGAR